jgi:asparagine synthase (glutamine-hydrolysing)
VCGICGIATTHGAADVDALRAMSDLLVHRGPDSAGEHVDSGVALAARRLSIIDLAHGDQPIANEDGTCVVVQNGEIYNYPELRRELERAGHVLRTHCDTEALVHLYEEHGLGFAERLRGMFAVAIWDASRRRLVLARDPYGIKPLYYRHAGDELRFASELRAMPRGEIDLDALEAFLAFNSIPAPYSIFRDVRKLPAGHLLVWENGVVTLERFGRPGPDAETELRTGDEAELVEELRARLRDSVRAHLLSDVPVGVLLSGGVDSAVLAALAAQETPEAVHTFTIGFEERSFDERADARRVAERYGTEHHELLVRPEPELLLRALAEAFDEPTRRRSRPISSRSSRPSTSRSRCRARAEMSSSAATTRTRRISSRITSHRWRERCVRSSRRCRPRPARRVSTTRRSDSCAPRTCRRSSGTMAGRRSSRSTPAAS